MNRSWQKLRTVPGQLALLGLVFFCAVVSGIVIVCLRVPVFERYCRETYSPLEGYDEEAGRILTNPASTAEQVAEVGKRLEERVQSATLNTQRSNTRFNDLEGLYGAWMRDESFDPGGYLARRLTRLQPDWVFRRIRGTLVAGSPNQQSRALAWLRIIAGEEGNAERIEEFALYTCRKAARRGDWEIQQQADALLALGCPRDGVR